MQKICNPDFEKKHIFPMGGITIYKDKFGRGWQKSQKWEE